MSDLPNRIRALRKERRLTLDQVAVAAGTTAFKISVLERGGQQLTLDWMRRVAAALDVAPNDLLLEADAGFNLSTEEHDLIVRMRAADPETRAKIAALIDLMAPPLAEASKVSAA